MVLEPDGRSHHLGASPKVTDRGSVANRNHLMFRGAEPVLRNHGPAPMCLAAHVVTYPHIRPIPYKSIFLPADDDNLHRWFFAASLRTLLGLFGVGCLKSLEFI